MGGGNQQPCWYDGKVGLGSTRRETNPNLYGIVDMGSNGIRFSISDLSESTARVLPTLYAYRSGISLYEAQYDDDGKQIPIPGDVQESVIGAFLRFEIHCADFGVPWENIRIIATEATRKAINGKEFVTRVARETGLEVEILSQEGEGETGAWGVASSSSEVRGLVMDLGGGSTQITWMWTKDGNMQISPRTAVSFPYGAAALTQRLQMIEKHSKSEKEADEKRAALREEMKKNFMNAYQDLEVSSELVEMAKDEGGFTLYLSGGGFRGWGYLLLYQAQKHSEHYPISIINGFVARKKDFTDTKELSKVAKRAKRIFRVSDRRRAQVPAVAFLVSVLAEVIPHGIKEAHFCQGGVREGVLFRNLPAQIRKQSPIEVGTSPYAAPLAPKLAKLLRDALPKKERPRRASLEVCDMQDGWDEVPSVEAMRQIPESFTRENIRALANMIYVHADMTKELSSTAALYSTSSGVLADTHGTSHRNRALLALLLEARYTGDLPPRDYAFRQALRRLLTPSELWWINYIGAVALVLSRIYPAGGYDDLESFENKVVESVDMTPPGAYCQYVAPSELHRPHHKKPHLSLRAYFVDDLGDNKDEPGLQLIFRLRMRGHNRDDPMKVQEAVETLSQKIEKIGKKKHWIRTDAEEDEADNEDLYSGASDDDQTEPVDDVEQEGWGMKVDVQIEVEYPPTQTFYPAGVV